MNVNLVKSTLDAGGHIKPLLVPFEIAKGTGQMNPSVFVDSSLCLSGGCRAESRQVEGRIFVNVRCTNYILCHSENKQRSTSYWGPLSYNNPENDVHLRTVNVMMELDEKLDPLWVAPVDTSKLDNPVDAQFIGLEDGRLVKWGGEYYLSGVRRDTRTDGQGRIELSQLKIRKDKVTEVKRTRLEPPTPSGVEKNWMPVLDQPFHLVKWTNPTEVVLANLETGTTTDAFLSHNLMEGFRDFRGGSQVIPWHGNYIAIVHEVELYNNEAGKKDGNYFHRFIVWNRNWEIIKMSDCFKFMGGQIEFCCGLAYRCLSEVEGTFFVTFGFQDNAAYILEMPEDFLNGIL